MTTIQIDDFRIGVDRRRARYVGARGSLWVGENVHLSRGGDLERAKKFVPEFPLPADTFGIEVVADQVFVFGSADLAASMPVGVRYQRLQAPSGAAMVGVADSGVFGGAAYVIARFADGHLYHFYNGSRVASWDAITQSVSVDEVAYALADQLARAADLESVASGGVIRISGGAPGDDFALQTDVVDAGGAPALTTSVLQAAVTAVAEVRATATFTITAGFANGNLNRIDDLTVDGTSLMQSGVQFGIDATATAAAVAAQIENASSVHSYNAAAQGAVVTITAPPNSGSAPNGAVTQAVVAGDVLVDTTPVAGGVDEVNPVAKVVEVTVSASALTPDDQFAVNAGGASARVTGRAALTGDSVFVHKRRVYSTARSLVRYCVLGDATDWSTTASPASDAGFINISEDESGSQRVYGLAKYDRNVAVFGNGAVLVYDIRSDATQNTLLQVLPNTGSVARGSIITYGASDVFYLDPTGVRSLRARDSSGAAFSNDVGALIDPLAAELVDLLPDAGVSSCAVVEPRDGRYLLALGGTILVLTNFTGTKVQGWTAYKPGFTPERFVRSGRRLYTRDRSAVYVYGGLSGNEYPGDGELPAVVGLPYLAAGDEPSRKQFRGYDVAVQNEWAIAFLPDPNDETVTIEGGVVDHVTYGGANWGLSAFSSHLAVELRCDRGGYAAVASMSLHFDGGPRA